MKTNTILGLLSAIVLTASCKKDKDPEPGLIEWQSVTGGYHQDKASAVAQGKDGGYMVVGAGFSMNTGDITGSRGVIDAIISKLDANGNKQWVKVYGGSDGDEFNAVAATPDGDYIVAGYSRSKDGDVAVPNLDDFWILKIDNDGKIKWSKTYGSTDIDQAKSIVVTADGGCVVTGFTEGNNGDVTGNHSKMPDVWILRLDANGNKKWAKTYGGSSVDQAFSVTACADGGFAITGYTASNDGDVTGYHGTAYLDTWVLKVDGEGNKLWNKCFGGTDSDYAHSIVSTPDGGLAIAGSTASVNGDITGLHHVNVGSPFYDAFVIKLDAAGNKQWAKAYGGVGSEGAYSLVTAPGGGYVFAGSAGSTDGDVYGNTGNSSSEYWLAKLDADGKLVWNNCYGSTGGDECASLIRTSDNGYALTGYIHRNDQHVKVETYGQFDWWTFKVTPL